MGVREESSFRETRHSWSRCWEDATTTAKLLEYIDRASLPDWLGGDDDTCDFGGVERGPWAGAAVAEHELTKNNLTVHVIHTPFLFSVKLDSSFS